eukprot:scaffold44750_cov54-Phaeocystis_antarctica.AAC.5
MASAALASAALLEPIALRGHRPMRPPASGSYSTGNLSVSIRFGRTVIGRSRSTVYCFVMAQSWIILCTSLMSGTMMSDERKPSGPRVVTRAPGSPLLGWAVSAPPANGWRAKSMSRPSKERPAPSVTMLPSERTWLGLGLGLGLGFGFGSAHLTLRRQALLHECQEAAVGAERQQPCVRRVLLRLKRAEAVGDQAHQERPATWRDERAVKEAFARRPFLLEAGRTHPRPRVPGLAGRVRRQAHAVDHAVAVEPASLLRGVLGLRVRPILQNGSTREVGR